VSAGVGEQLERFTSGAAIAVDVASIEKELASLWRASAGAEHQVSRACLWNLVVWAERPDDFARAKQLVDAVAPACPARVLMLHLAPGDGPELAAWVEANCHGLPGGGKVIASEEITLAARGRGEEHLPALIRALMVPDVPAALYWAGAPPTDEARVKRLISGVDRMIIDTGDLGGPGDGAELRGLAELLRIAAAVDLSDLGWLRQAAFRALLAGMFERPVGGAPLRRLAKVRLDCARHGAATAQLLLGWLAARLDWPRPERQAAARWRAGAVDVEIVVRNVDAGRDGIFQILLETDRAERFSITDSGPEWLEVAGAGLPTRTVAAPDAARPDAELLVAALGARGHDPLFGVALRRAAELEA
jgi:hypothetical protein